MLTLVCVIIIDLWIHYGQLPYKNGGTAADRNLRLIFGSAASAETGEVIVMSDRLSDDLMLDGIPLPIIGEASGVERVAITNNKTKLTTVILITVTIGKLRWTDIEIRDRMRTFHYRLNSTYFSFLSRVPNYALFSSNSCIVWGLIFWHVIDNVRKYGTPGDI